MNNKLASAKVIKNIHINTRHIQIYILYVVVLLQKCVYSKKLLQRKKNSFCLKLLSI